MNTKIQKTAQILAILPMFAIANPSAIIADTKTRLPEVAPIVSLNVSRNIFAQANEVTPVPQVVDTRAARIDAYFGKWDLPLEGHGKFMVEMADKYNLDWQLIPAIAMRESTGGKFACYNNPFGWGSCKIKFGSFEEAIEAIAKNLGGANPNTEMYYKDKSTEEKLHFYNGTVIKTYVREVVKIMDRIEAQKLEA